MTAQQLPWTSQVVSRRAALAHGRSPDEVRALLTSGAWTTLRRGQYCPNATLAAASPGRRLHLELLALVRHLGRPAAVLSRDTAGRLHGLLVPEPRGVRIHQLTDPDRTRSGRGFRMTRAALPAGDVTTLGPFPVTAAARTAIDCCRSLLGATATSVDTAGALVPAVALLDDALLRRMVTPAELGAVLDSSPSHKGNPGVRRALALADGRAESWLESAWRVRHVTSGLPTPLLQVEIWIDGVLVKVVDGWLKGHAIAIETDGKIKYTDAYAGRAPAEVAWREKRSEDALRAVGIRVVRPIVSDVGAGWPAMQARLARLVAQPTPRLEAFTAVPRAAGRVRPSSPRWAAELGDGPR